MAISHYRISCRRAGVLPFVFETLEDRRLLAAVTLDAATTYQTIQGWGTAVYPTDQVTIAQAGSIMRDAGMNVVRIAAGPGDYTATVGGNMSTPVPISANLDENVLRFNSTNSQADLINWLKVNGLDPDRTKMIGSLWSPPQWLKITTGTLISWNGGANSGYDPVLPWGAYGGNTGAGRVDPTKWTDWARYVLSTVKVFQKRTGLPMYAFSFQNEPNVPTSYNSCTFSTIANDVNNPSAGSSGGHWELWGDGLQALATELASHPEITTKFFGPELSQLGGGSSLTSCNPYNMGNYNAVRQNLISRGLLQYLGAYATHEYTNASGGDAALWDAWYNGSQHAANIVSGGTSNYLDYLSPQPGIGGDGKEIWQTETEGEDQTWTKDGAMAFGLKIQNALVYGHVSGYTSWTLTGYSATDQWGVVQLGDISNPSNSYKFDAFKQFSRWIRPGAQRINATFDNGKASVGGANELDTYNGLTVSAFNHAQDKRLTMVFTNMETSAQSTTITIPAGMNISSFQVYQTSGTQKYVQLADLIPSNGQITLTIPASSFVTVTGSYAAQALPAGWTTTDIGVPTLAGSSSYDRGTGTYTLLGSGSDVWGSSDQAQFAYTPVYGSGQITACVTSVTNTNTAAKAGVMFRDSTAANAAYAYCWVSPSNTVVFETRSTNGSYSNYSYSVSPGLSPVWVRMVRAGANRDQFSAFYSQDGVAWTQVGATQTVTMATNAVAGLAVTSHTNSVLCTGTFTGVQVIQNFSIVAPATATLNPTTGSTTNLSVLGTDTGSEAGLTYTWAMTSGPAAVTFSANGTNAAKNTTATFTQAGTYIFQVTITNASGLSITSSVAVPVMVGIFTSATDIGSPSLAGSNNYASSTDAYTVVAGGTDIWGSTDQFRYIYSAFGGTGQLTARVTSVSNTNASAKAGVMFRDSTANNAAYAFVWVPPGGNKVVFETRSTNGSYSNSSNSVTLSFSPIWVRLIRSGTNADQFSAYYSRDGVTWTQVGATQTVTLAATTPLAGLAVTAHTSTALNTSVLDNVSMQAASTNNAPILTVAASATPNPVTGKTTTLSAAAIDDAGQGSLTYNWTVTSKPTGALDPTFSINGTNAAKSTITTFKQAGSYSFTVTITDAGGLSTTSSVSVMVNQTLSSISVTPATTSLPSHATQQFAATAYDQFGAAMATQPSFTWALASGVGSINTSTGLYTASYASGSATITASSGSITSSPATITVTNATPGTTAASASPNPVSGTTTTLSVVATDDAGEANLTYNWSVTSKPTGSLAPTFSVNNTNAAKNTTATFSQAGNYSFTVTITDLGGLSTTTSVSVTVSQTLTGIAITPGTASLASHGQQQFSASAFDQFGFALATQPTITWSVSSGSGTVSATGLYTAPYASGSATVTATSGTVTNNASVTITNAAPTVSTAASATPNPANGTTTTLSVTGADDAGEANLSYAWSVTGKPTGALDPTFSINGTNAAKNTLATFTKSGTYSFTVTITDAGGRSTTSSVSVTVNQTFSTITVTPASMTIVQGASQQFAAVVYDQFGIAALSQPTFSWSVSGGGAIDASGLFTAASGLWGSYQVTATAAGLSGSTQVTVTDVTAPTLVSASSHKVHGAAGTFDLPLSLTGSTIEPRSGGASTLILNFSEAVRAVDGVLSANEFVLTNASFLSASINGSTLTLNLTGVVDQKWMTLTLAGLSDLAGNLLTGDLDLKVGNLYGDVNQSGSVSVADQQSVKNQLLGTVTGSSFLLDLNLSGTISVADQQIVKNNLLHRLL